MLGANALAGLESFLISLPLADSGGATDSAAETNPWIMLAIAAVLVALNGFFVAAEFALVKVRISQIDRMVKDNLMFASSAKWLAQRLDHSLSACQLGITMASLALGYVGEPAFAFLIEPLLKYVNITSDYAVHVIAFIFAFSVITSLHLVIGEQAPKIWAIRKPKDMVRWCAPLMILFYYMLFPFMYVLNWATEVVLGMLGLSGSSGHDSPHSEDEIRALLREAHIHGQLSGSEHYLLNNVFEFDDLICRLAMVPRSEVQIMDINQPFPELIELARKTKHTRYPVCDASLDNLLGVVHMKDLLGVDGNDESFDVRSIMREPIKVPENMPISLVLKRIQNTHQLLTFVVDEYGTIIGICTLENVLEKIIGPVDDEFDDVEQPSIKSLGGGKFVVLGNTPISEVEKQLKLNLDDQDVDTLAGVLMARSGKVPELGDVINFDGATAEIVDVKHDHAELVEFQLDSGKPEKKMLEKDG
ncbi:MAG: hemolysin family protein [Planctomycetota bacterium]